MIKNDISLSDGKIAKEQKEKEIIITQMHLKPKIIFSIFNNEEIN